MTGTQKRPNAVRLTVQFAAAGALVSIIVGGCSTDVKTVTVEDCPIGGTASVGGHATTAAGTHSGEMGGSESSMEMAGDAGIGQSGESSGGSSGGGGSAGVGFAGNGGTAGGGGKAGGGGTAGNGGRASGGGSGGKSTTSGGSANAGGSSGRGGTGNVGGPEVAVCGDTAVTPPEFCDDRSNTDLSYGCAACTTLPTGTAGASQQCDACLQTASKPSSCFGCKDYRACYACLRRQPDDGDICEWGGRDDDSYPYSPKGYSDLCFNPSDTTYQAATGGPAGNKPRGLVCQALVACALRTGCATDTGPSMFNKCYCGVIPTGTQCADPNFVPNGPCVNEVINADAPAVSTTGVGLTLEIATNLNDLAAETSHVALAWAKHIVDCAVNTRGCADVCSPFSASGGNGGSGGRTGVGGNAGP